MDKSTKKWARMKYRAMSFQDRKELRDLKRVCDLAAVCMDYDEMIALNNVAEIDGKRQDAKHGQTLVNLILDYVIR